MDEQFRIASDALRAAVEELESMNFVRLDVPDEEAYQYPEKNYGVQPERVAQTIPEDIVAFNPDFVLNRVAQAKQAIERVASIAGDSGGDARERISIYQETVAMVESAGKAYKPMRAAALLFWDGLEQYQAGEYERAYGTLITAHNAIRGEDNDAGIPNPTPFIDMFFSKMDTLTTSDFPDGYNQDDRHIWGLHWALRASSTVGEIRAEWVRVFGGVRSVADLCQRYQKMKAAYQKNDWDNTQFHLHGFGTEPESIQEWFANDPDLRLPNVLDGYDKPGLCIGQDTAGPVADMEDAVSRKRGDLLEDAMNRFETAIENCPSFPEPPSNR